MNSRRISDLEVVLAQSQEGSRPCSRAMQPVEALEECRRCTGSQFFVEPVEILGAPAFERTRRIFANDQIACGGVVEEG
jgi:hypothetical protein